MVEDVTVHQRQVPARRVTEAEPKFDINVYLSEEDVQDYRLDDRLGALMMIRCLFSKFDALSLSSVKN